MDRKASLIIQTCQIDVHVRYCNKSENQVCVHYLDSKFMGHTTANDPLKNLLM